MIDLVGGRLVSYLQINGIFKYSCLYISAFLFNPAYCVYMGFAVTSNTLLTITKSIFPLQIYWYKTYVTILSDRLYVWMK